MSQQLSADQFQKFLASQGLEQEFLKSTGLTSLDELHPVQFRNVDAETSTPKLTTKSSSDPKPSPPQKMEKSTADAKTGFQPQASSDILFPYISTSITYASRKAVSSYTPSSLMMFYLIHLANSILVDNFYFKRHCPDYHPYILRLYFGIIFWIQCLRAAADVNALDTDYHQFLTRFLDAHPLESLPIIGPLVPLFKTLCTSNPEIPNFGKVYPKVPNTPGPTARSHFLKESSTAFVLPNVPGIFALLENLNAVTNAETPVYPKKGRHLPVTNAAVTFGHHAFPAVATRTAHESWSLISPGLEYPCEADARLNEAFAERYDNFNFPTTTATDNLTLMANFLSMNNRTDWFNQVKDVAASAALYFEGSGTLADCAPSGIVSNQIMIKYSNTDIDLPRPTKIADPASLFPFAFKMTTTARALPPLAEAMAAQAQTFVRPPQNHPHWSNLNRDNATRTGQFWSIRPIEKSSEDDSSYLAMHGLIKKMMKSRV